MGIFNNGALILSAPAGRPAGRQSKVTRPAGRRWTWQGPASPDVAPILKIKTGPSKVIASITAQESSSTDYWALYTMPNSKDTFYVAEWFAKRTIISSAFELVKREKFKIIRTDPET
jgi:hypothetical protein